jgi:hypothetical protein
MHVGDWPHGPPLCRSKGDGTESYAMTMRLKLPNAFRYGFTGTPWGRSQRMESLPQRRQLIEENTSFIQTAEALPVYKIDKDYVTKLDELPMPADKAAALEAILTRELEKGDPGFTYRQLGERPATEGQKGRNRRSCRGASQGITTPSLSTTAPNSCKVSRLVSDNLLTLEHLSYLAGHAALLQNSAAHATTKP